MTRTIGAICALVALGACQPRIPDSAAAANAALPSPQAVSQETIPEPPQLETVPVGAQSTPLTTTQTATPTAAAAPPQTEAEGIAQETTAALAAASANSGVAPLDASPSNPAPEVFSNPGISDENDFSAVGERRSIEDDAARRAQNQANYKVIEPTAVPKRSGVGGPNIVAYALETNHPRGTKMYSRLGLGGASRYTKACAKFGSDEAAQLAFLERGGPKNDRLGVDPDGDGYACEWDPTPFRKATGN
ncbi:hypothetical protein [Shimia marina]|uniref:Excalibur calcium-binding domain-containing protein n=1 Tax=Shimia marina TaxID=321267 RepID=A0A0N7LS36_9RHOB|nr:hypothetical protein [Shimia marina]CUH52524.1 hypothetical protein SHM7688_01971 [Shimia marina]SFE48977.1 hypothetical protein SAMN04488037_11025 [Shimia marina]